MKLNVLVRLLSVICLSVLKSINFLAHLSKILMWAFLIACRESVCPAVCKLFTFYLLQNHHVNFNQNTKYPWVNGIKVCWNEGPYLFPRGDDIYIYTDEIKKSSPDQLADFYQTWHLLRLWRFSLLKWRAMPFERGDNNEKAKIHWRNVKLFFSRTDLPVSTKSCKKHPLVMEIKVCWNEGLHPFPRWDNKEILEPKYIHEILKSPPPEPMGHFQPNLAQSIFGLWEFKFV